MSITFWGKNQNKWKGKLLLMKKDVCCLSVEGKCKGIHNSLNSDSGLYELYDFQFLSISPFFCK